MKRSKRRSYKIYIAMLLCSGLFCMAAWGAYMAVQKQNVPDAVKSVIKQNQSDVQNAEKQSDNKDKAKDSHLNLLKTELISLVEDKYPEAELSFYLKNMDNGDEIIYNDKKMNSASLIKLFIMETVYKEVAAGRYDLTPDKKKELTLMITESKNDAANLFIDDFGGVDETRKVKVDNVITTTIRESGYVATELNRKMYNSTPPGGPTGYENYTSVTEVAQLYERIYNGTAIDAQSSAEMLDMLKNQQRRWKLPSLITEKYPHIVVANKTGELSQVENDAAIIMSDDFNLIFVVLINEIPRTDAGEADYALKEQVQKTMGEMGLMVVEHYLPDKYKVADIN